MIENLRRLVSLSASTTAILHAAGAEDRLVAVTRDCARLTPQVAGLPVVGDAWSATAEEVAEFEPDLVVAAAPLRGEVVAGLIERRLRFFGCAPWTLDEVFRDMRSVAALVGGSDAIDVEIDALRLRLREVRLAVAGRRRPTVYCEVWMQPIMSSPVWVSELIEAAGGEPVIEAAQVLKPEAILEADPEVVVMAWCGAIGRSDPSKFAGRSGFDRLSAVRSGRVIAVREEFLNAPCQHLARGLEILAHALHPDVFGPLDPALGPVPHLRVLR